MGSKKNYIAVYRGKGIKEWKLITREVATKRHAIKKAEQYEEGGYEIKMIKVEEDDEIN